MKATLYRNGLAFEGELTFIGRDTKGRPAYLSYSAAPDFARMSSAAAKEGIELLVNTAWRDHEWQKRLYAEYEEMTRKWVEAGGKGSRPLAPSRPGHSRHESGDAVDIDLVDSDGNERPAKKWLAANAASFGFRNPIHQEPWHWEHDPLSVFQPNKGA